MSLNNKPLAYYRQPLLGRADARPLRMAYSMLALALVAAGMGLSLSQPWKAAKNSDWAPVASMATTAPTVAEPLAIAMPKALSPEQAHQAAMEQRKQALALRISDTYRRPLTDVRTIVDSAHVSGQKHEVDPVLLLAIAAVESSFDPNAVSSVGAQGLLQALPRAHPEKFDRIRAEGKSPFDPVVSMDLGGQIYAEYYNRFDGDRTLALQQYNGSLKDETRKYSNKVMAAYRFLADDLPYAPTS